MVEPLFAIRYRLLTLCGRRFVGSCRLNRPAVGAYARCWIGGAGDTVAHVTNDHGDIIANYLVNDAYKTGVRLCYSFRA